MIDIGTCMYIEMCVCVLYKYIIFLIIWGYVVVLYYIERFYCICYIFCKDYVLF